VPCAAFRPEQASWSSQVPVLPVPQQAWPEPPQSVAHTSPFAEILQDRPVSQVLPAPKPPPPGQQDWPAPPQALQVPTLTPPSTRVVKQPSPLWQLLPSQQAAPAAPQLSQVLAVRVSLQPSPSLQVLPEQQGLPELPHAMQICAPSSDLAQTREAPHWLDPVP
jgi:hypothetical protein